MNFPKNYYHLNLIANILLILIGTILIGLLSYYIFLQPTLAPLEPELLKTGGKFKGLKEFNFEKNHNTIILAMDTKCEYCSKSISFYKKIIAKSKEYLNVEVIAVFKNNEEEVEKYLEEHEIDIEHFSNINLMEMRVDITPTIIWLNNNRTIVGAYEGWLQESQELAFLKFFDEKLSNKR